MYLFQFVVLHTGHLPGKRLGFVSANRLWFRRQPIFWVDHSTFDFCLELKPVFRRHQLAGQWRTHANPQDCQHGFCRPLHHRNVAQVDSLWTLEILHQCLDLLRLCHCLCKFCALFYQLETCMSCSSKCYNKWSSHHRCQYWAWRLKAVLIWPLWGPCEH